MKICKCGCNRRVFSNGFSMFCQHKRTDEKWRKKQDKIRKKEFKASGEGILFNTILSTREHISFISGLYIENIDHNNCHHVLTKKDYPNFRLFDKNIILLTNIEHNLIHFGTISQREKYAKENNCSWDKLYKLKEELKLKYK